MKISRVYKEKKEEMEKKKDGFLVFYQKYPMNSYKVI